MSLLKYHSWAVVIKDINKQYEIVETLKNKGCKVVGINKIPGNSNGIEIYESLKDVPHNIDVIGIIEESSDIYMILEEMELLDISDIWFSKNSYSDECIKKAKSMKLNIEYNLDSHV